MAFSVGIHPPKTPITAGSGGEAKNTLPNVCKMPGPPAPFVPSPLPNIGKSELSPKGYSTSVMIEGKAIAIRGATFESMGDMASKGTGGGLISANTHGPTKFIGPGSMTVQVEAKAVHLLGEPMLNNCGPGGSPPNTGATLAGIKNPESKKKKPPPPCPDGQHSEVLQYPTAPDAERDDPKTRIERGRETSNNTGDEFEMEAALHNASESGSTLKSGDQIGRNLNETEKRAGKPGDSQKLHMVCTICGKKREVDHALSDKSIVEAKSGDPNDPGQLANNRKFVQDGGTVTYKLPEPVNPQRQANLEAQGFSVEGVGFGS
jgi:hypothetical protein